ncbi:hypothetical protein V8F20_000211 [Naviculisporaceae sp. PSN 640]
MIPSLWSTAAQQLGCHCRACIRTTTNAIGRRATTTAARRRKAGLGEIFVRCYSAIMATAAVTDAFYKDRRRSMLDVEIAEAKAKLTKLMETSQTSDLARLYETSDKLNDKFLDYPQEKQDPLHSFAIIPKPRLYYDTHHVYKQVLCLSREQKELLPRWNFRDSPSIDSLRKLRAALESEENREQVAGMKERHPLNQEQWRRMVKRINRLVDDLLLVSWRTSEAEAFNETIGPGNPQSPFHMIWRLRAEGYPTYQHPSTDQAKTERAYTRLNALNQSNLDAFATWGREARQLHSRRSHYVARICYNLLVSEVAPGISTYNHLMVGFMELGEFELAKAVADSFLFRSRLKPTPTTILCLLQLSRLRQDVWEFRRLAQRILGYRYRGIILRRRKVKQIQEDKRVARWARTHAVVAVRDWAVEIPQIDWAHYEVFLEAFLDFRLIRNAMDVFLYCIRYGYAPNGEVVRRLLHALISSADGSLIRHAVAGMLHEVEALTNMLYDERFCSWTYNIADKIRTLLAFRSCDHISKVFDRERKSLIKPADAKKAIDTRSDFEAFVKAFAGNDKKATRNTTSRDNNDALRAAAELQQPPTPHGGALNQLAFATWVVCVRGQLAILNSAVRDAHKVFNNWNVLRRKGGKFTVVKRNRIDRAEMALKLVTDAVETPRAKAAVIEGHHLAGAFLWVEDMLKEREKKIYTLDKVVRRAIGRIRQRRGEPIERWHLPPLRTAFIGRTDSVSQAALARVGQPVVLEDEVPDVFWKVKDQSIVFKSIDKVTWPVKRTTPGCPELASGIEPRQRPEEEQEREREQGQKREQRGAWEEMDIPKEPLHVDINFSFL